MWLVLLAFILPVIVMPFEIPMPGGRRMRFDDGGIIRIQLADEALLPPAPPLGSYPEGSTLASIEVRDTETVKGFGAFCTRPLAKHTFLGFYDGVLVKGRESLDIASGDRTSMDYVMSIDGGSIFLDGYVRAQNRSSFSPVHMNHAEKGNEGCNCLRVLSNGQVAFFTSRDVLEGEELCFDYGKNYWEGRESEKI